MSETPKNSSQAGTDITLKPYRLEPVCINTTHAHAPPAPCSSCLWAHTLGSGCALDPDRQLIWGCYKEVLPRMLACQVEATPALKVMWPVHCGRKWRVSWGCQIRERHRSADWRCSGRDTKPACALIFFFLTKGIYLFICFPLGNTVTD